MSPRCLLPLLFTALAAPVQAFEVERVSVDGNGSQIPRDSQDAAISFDGRYVAFTTSAGLFPGDTNDMDDVYVRDRQTGELRLVSRSFGALPADRPSRQPDVNADGNVVFVSAASNLVQGDSAGQSDIFYYDWNGDSLVRVTRGLNGTEADNGSSSPRFSRDGRVLVFESRATNLVPDDTNATQDIFIFSLVLGEIRRVSLTSTGGQLSGPNASPTISSDGLLVAFSSLAPEINQQAASGLEQVFTHNVITGKTTRVAVPSGTIERSDVFRTPVLSGDGEWVAFLRIREGGGGTADVFLQELDTGESIRVTEPIGEPQAGLPHIGGVSFAGEAVVFDAPAENLIPGDSNGEKDVFRYDRLQGRLSRVSGPGPNAGGNGESTALDITADGEAVLFASRANNLVAGDTNGAQDIFLNDLAEFRIDVDITGSWYDLTQDGHGFILEYLDGNRLLFYWFTFTPGGDREWIFGVLDVGADGRVAEGQAFRQLGDGARFPPAIDPAGISTEAWGTIRFEFTDCDAGTVSWDAAPPYQDGSMNLTRLTSLAGRGCD